MLKRFDYPGANEKCDMVQHLQNGEGVRKRRNKQSGKKISRASTIYIGCVRGSLRKMDVPGRWMQTQGATS